MHKIVTLSSIQYIQFIVYSCTCLPYSADSPQGRVEQERDGEQRRRVVQAERHMEREYRQRNDTQHHGHHHPHPAHPRARNASRDLNALQRPRSSSRASSSRCRSCVRNGAHGCSEASRNHISIVVDQRRVCISPPLLFICYFVYNFVSMLTVTELGSPSILPRSSNLLRERKVVIGERSRATALFLSHGNLGDFRTNMAYVSLSRRLLISQKLILARVPKTQRKRKKKERK